MTAVRLPANWSLGQLWAQSTCSQSRTADLQDAGALQRDTNVGCTSETGRKAAELAGLQMTASGHTP